MAQYYLSRLGCVATLMAAIVAADNAFADNDFEITPFGALTTAGSFSDDDDDFEADINDSGGFGLILNLRQHANTQWELIYSYQGTDTDISGSAVTDETLDLDIHHLQIGGTYQGSGERVRPYLAATLGAGHYTIDGDGYDSETFWSFSIGPGLQIQPNSRLGLRLEARAFGTLVRSGSDLFCVSNPGGGNAGCAIAVSGDVLWQVQALAGVVFRF